ncbi:MAG: DUF4245 domain-containing protein [Leucobacter sp.]|nr:DUF4245 domain-containing protein [Leucobacter sp.]
MAGTPKSPVIVAELGRPETPAETAARKAENSRLYRQRKTVNNLVFSLLATLGVVLLIVLIVPRGVDVWRGHSVDVASAATAASPTAGHPLVAPEVPDGWLAKQAEIRSGGDRIAYWYIGYTTVNEAKTSEAYAAVVEAFTADGSPVDESWIAGQLEAQAATGTETIGGIEWTVYDHSDRSPDAANMLFGLQAQVGQVSLIVYGTDTPDAIRGLAASVAASAQSIGLEG